MTPQRFAIDTGGTFTDAVSAEGRVVKVPSRRDAPHQAMAEALAALGAKPGDELVHGTTIATNAVLEARWAKVALLVNEGFRDLLSIGRQARPDLYALQPQRPAWPVPDELVFPIRGRLDANGVELVPLDLSAVRAAGKAALAGGAEAIAIVFLHAWSDPQHERLAAEALEDLGLPITASHTIAPEFREVERGTAAVLNAALRPIVQPYLQQLKAALPGIAIGVMDSTGAVLPPSRAALEPARLLLSGPSGGVVAAAAWARELSLPLLLTLDMGGTSTDVALIESGRVPAVPEFEIAGHRLRLSALAIHTIGAGGGSLLSTDEGQAVKVGPKSAGADPGPAAYGRGDGIALTDAHLLLGRIDPASFASGRIPLHLDRAAAMVQASAQALGMEPQALLEGMLRIAEAAMLRALRKISVDRGRDPRDGALLAFGGAGGLHAVELARSLGIARVIWPPDAGVLSAEGLLAAPVERTKSRTVPLGEFPTLAARQAMALELERVLVVELCAEGARSEDLEAKAALDVRYRGQSYELEVEEHPDVQERFHQLHADRFGFADRGRALELVAVRVKVAVRGAGSRPRWRPPEAPRGAVGSARMVRPLVAGVPHHPWIDREMLGADARVVGPLAMSDRTSSFWLPAGAEALVHQSGAIIVETGA